MAKNKELGEAEPLSNWYKLQEALMSSDEKGVAELLELERKGANRERFMRRIHSRLNRLRAERERAEIAERAKVKVAS